jgi:hypothetical protein
MVTGLSVMQSQVQLQVSRLYRHPVHAQMLQVSRLYRHPEQAQMLQDVLNSR